MAEQRTGMGARRGVVIGALVAGGLVAGGVIAGTMTANAADSTGTGTGTGSSTAAPGYRAPDGRSGRPGGPPGAGRGGTVDESKSQRPDEKLLTGDTAEKVTAAALARYPGATVQRVETDSDGVYEAHLTTADGKRVTVELDTSFAITGEEAAPAGGPGGGPQGGQQGQSPEASPSA